MRRPEQKVGPACGASHRGGYRVLLTRARQGIAIFVPTGRRDNLTRLQCQCRDLFKYLENVRLHTNIKILCIRPRCRPFTSPVVRPPSSLALIPRSRQSGPDHCPANAPSAPVPRPALPPSRATSIATSLHCSTLEMRCCFTPGLRAIPCWVRRPPFSRIEQSPRRWP